MVHVCTTASACCPDLCRVAALVLIGAPRAQVWEAVVVTGAGAGWLSHFPRDGLVGRVITGGTPGKPWILVLATVVAV